MALDSNMVIPAHVALILDGNGRWAKKRGLPRTFGHKEGCITVEKTVETAARMGIKYLTVYGFSTENWKRSEEEVGALMQLFRYYMVRLLKIAAANNVRVKMIGDRRRFAQDIIDGINRLEEETKNNTGLTFVIAVNYGGRDEIRRAAGKLAEDVKEGRLQPEDITESVFASYLDTADIPDPDLLIRRIYVTACHVRTEQEAQKEQTYEQMSLFDFAEETEEQKAQKQALQKEKQMQKAMLSIKQRYGKNAILKGTNFKEGATMRQRNGQIGGHRA